MDKPSLILVVDDNPNFREIFLKKLQSEGFQVETAASGQEGIDKAKKLKPDLVLMDIKMEGMDGVEAFLKMKQDPEAKDIRVVFLTSLGGLEDEAMELNKKFSKDIGASGYIRKSDDLNAIVSEVKSFLK